MRRLIAATVLAATVTIGGLTAVAATGGTTVADVTPSVVGTGCCRG
jgi:hypothetical protein